MGVYRHVPRSCVDGKLAQVRRARANKGTTEYPIITRRLVAMEFASTEGPDDLFAGTPPLYAVRALLSSGASQARARIKTITIMDVKCVFLY